MEVELESNYYRRDRNGGITAPDLSKDCAVADHIVRARGKRTRFTSVSLDRNKIDDFGPSLYQARCPEIVIDGHRMIEHSKLIALLRQTAGSSQKAERGKALIAERYARRRREGLIDWQFKIDGVERKDIISWADRHVQKYFQVVS